MSYVEQEQEGGRIKSSGGCGKAVSCSPLERTCVEVECNSELEDLDTERDILDQLDVSTYNTEDTNDFEENLESALVFMWEEYKKTEVLQIESVVTNSDDGKTCSECGRKFTRRRSRDDHVNAVHRKEKHFQCNEPRCTKKYIKAFDLKRHRQEVHMKEEFKCNIKGCEKIFKSKYTRNIHVKHTHDKRGRVKCEECEKTFYDRRGMESHQRRAHNEPFE